MTVFQPNTLILSLIPEDILRCELSERTGAAKPYFELLDTALLIKNVPVPVPMPPKELDIVRSVLGYSFFIHRVMVKVFPHYWLQGRSRMTRAHSDAEGVACSIFRQLDNSARSHNVKNVFILVQHEKELKPQELAMVYRVTKCIDDPLVKVIDLRTPLLEVKRLNRETYESFFDKHMTYEGNYFVARQLRDAIGKFQS